MSIQIHTLEREPIIMLRHTSLEDGMITGRQVIAAATEYQEAVHKPVFAIWDMTGQELNFGNVVAALAAFREAPDYFWEKVSVCLIGTHALVDLMADASAQVQYGQRTVRTFASIKEALAYCREQIKLSV